MDETEWKGIVALVKDEWDHHDTGSRGEQDCHKQKLRRSERMYEKSPSSRVHEHPDFRVTYCLHFDTTHPYFAHIEQMSTSIFCTGAIFL
jgi:hypothetical protein